MKTFFVILTMIAANVSWATSFPPENCLDDPSGNDVGVIAPVKISGFDINKLCLQYDPSADILNVLVTTFTNPDTGEPVIFGDADGDGDPGNASDAAKTAIPGFVDFSDLSSVEYFSLIMDFDNDPSTAPNFIAGVSFTKDISGFSVAKIADPNMALSLSFIDAFYGAAIGTSSGSAVASSPDAANPSLEFTVTNFSAIDGFGMLDFDDPDYELGLYFAAGSLADAGIGEDAFGDTNAFTPIKLSAIVKKAEEPVDPDEKPKDTDNTDDDTNTEKPVDTGAGDPPSEGGSGEEPQDSSSDSGWGCSLILPVSGEGRKNSTYADGKKIEYVIDDSAATFRVTIPEKEEFEVNSQAEADQLNVLHASYAGAAKIARYEVLPSFEQIGFLGKTVDDRIYASIELAVEDDKIEILKLMAPQLKGEAQLFICTALVLSGAEGLCPKDVRARAAAQADKFKKDDPFSSKPIGFYSWDKELGRIFTRDRWLQKKFDTRSEKELRLAKELTALGQAKPLYSNIIGLYQILTNPTTNYFSALDKVTSDKPFAFFPPSRSKETDLINELTAKGNVTAGKTMDILIDAIRTGKISLRPGPNSGWYDYQQFAIEPFLLTEKMPEGKKLSFNELYKKRLENSFRSSVTQARETHVKQLERVNDVGAVADEEKVIEIDLTVRPDFELEPMPTYYLRTGQAYAFLIKGLDTPYLNNKVIDLHAGEDINKTSFGPEMLNRPPPEMVNAKLKKDIMPLFYQFAHISSFNLGLDNSDAGLEQARKFTADWSDWPAMKDDVRVIVPIGPLDDKDPSKGYNYWAVLGIEPINIDVEYDKKPSVRVLRKGVKANIKYRDAHWTILMPVFAEVVIPSSSPPTREEFRKVCDKYKTKEKVIAALRKGLL